MIPQKIFRVPPIAIVAPCHIVSWQVCTWHDRSGSGTKTGSLTIGAYYFNQTPTLSFNDFSGKTTRLRDFPISVVGVPWSLCLSSCYNAHIKRCFSYLLRFRGILSVVCCLAFAAICHGRNRLTRSDQERPRGREPPVANLLLRDPGHRMPRVHKANQIYNRRDLHLDGCIDDWQAFIRPTKTKLLFILTNS